MSRLLSSVSAIILMVVSITMTGVPAVAWDGDDGQTGTGSSAHSDSGYVLTLSAIRKISSTADHGGPSTGPALYYDFAPACKGNGPSDGDALCAQALRACRQSDRSALLYYVFRGTDPAALANVGTACLGDSDFVDRTDLSRDVVDQLVRRLPLTAPRIETAPPERTLVHLPTVVWATNPRTGEPDQPTYRISGVVDDVAVTLTVTGTWTWRLGDDRPPATLHSAGVPYQPGAPDPRVEPDYYTAHDGGADTGLVTSYSRRGTARLSLTLTWSPSYTVDHQVGTTRLDDAAVTYTATRDLRVGEARAILVSR